ncbi:hypothetical protein BDB13_1040 [Rhodococcus sp. OK302]|nr:hypothetical protein BDB13_1040 [Rhodococcus sp. OK302]
MVMSRLAMNCGSQAGYVVFGEAREQSGPVCRPDDWGLLPFVGTEVSLGFSNSQSAQ